jgi:hypothetical protein
MNGRIVLSLLLWLACVVNAVGQVNCKSSTKLVCQVPFASGTTVGGGTVSSDVITAAAGFNAPIAAQLSQLPLSSSSSGIVTLLGPGGVPTNLENLGPILTDSGQTIGKNKLFVGFSFQQYNFNAINGIPLRNVPFTYPATVGSSTYWVQSAEHISFKYDQYVTTFTVGLTDKTDVSLILPINRVSLGVGSVGPQYQYIFTPNDSSTATWNGTSSSNPAFVPGIASGVGDLLFNVKHMLWTGSNERATIAGGFLLRAPTGNALNYLGSGAWGFNPYAIFSYQARVSPHARLGYQWNTNSVLMNPTGVPGQNQNLPGGLQFDVGADIVAAKHVTIAADILGNQFLNSPTLIKSTVGDSRSLYQYVPIASFPSPTNPNLNTTVGELPTVIKLNSSYTVSYFSIGVKWNPWKEMLLYANVLIQMNNVGLRSDPVPLVGISYKFF